MVVLESLADIDDDVVLEDAKKYRGQGCGDMPSEESEGVTVTTLLVSFCSVVHPSHECWKMTDST